MTESPDLLWISAHLAVPPWSGESLKTACALHALSAAGASVDLIACGSTKQWSSKVAAEFGPSIRPAALLCSTSRARRNFISVSPRFASTRRLPQREVGQLVGASPERIVVFDDIVWATVSRAIAARSILAINDCGSDMFRAHARSAQGWEKLKALTRMMIARHYEKHFLPRFRRIVVLVREDARRLDQIVPGLNAAVIPNYSLSNPLHCADAVNGDSVGVWADLRTQMSREGLRRFLRGWLSAALPPVRIVVIGRLSETEAHRAIKMPEGVRYFQYWEKAIAAGHRPGVVVVPDLGGTGMKNRCANVVERSLGLVCTPSQLAGFDLRHTWAATASEPEDLPPIAYRLSSGAWRALGFAASSAYTEQFSRVAIGNQWKQMIFG